MAGRISCKWEVVMPEQMERFTCHCGRKGFKKFVAAQTRIQQRFLHSGQWKFTHGTYALPSGGGSEESYIYINPWQDRASAMRDAEETARRAVAVVCRKWGR